MKKYHVLKVKSKDITPWEREMQRSEWRMLQRYRYERKHNIQYFGDAIDDLPSDDDTYITVQARIMRSELYNAINQLDEYERFIIRSYFFDQKTEKEVGVLIGKSQQTVSRKIEEILEKMLKLLNFDKKSE